MILFSLQKPRKKSCLAIKRVLDTFCNVSNQKRNHSKSKIFFSPCTVPKNIEIIVNEFEISTFGDFGKDLGAPIITNKRNTRALGRLTLINSITTAIPTHLMQCNLLPPKICKEIDKLNCNFLWGDSIQKKKIHLKNLDLVDRPKFFGGLGIKKVSPKTKPSLPKDLGPFIQTPQIFGQTLLEENILKISLPPRKSPPLGIVLQKQVTSTT